MTSIRVVAGLLLAVTAAAPSPLLAATVSEQDLVAQAQTLAGDFQANLKAALMQAMSAGGPVKAIDVCRTEAPQIAGELSNDGWVVARTALKVRNPANAADSWEQASLEKMAKGLAAGKAPASLVETQIRETGDVRTFYYMQPIITGKLCLSCHGTQLAPDVQQALQKHYPQDAAVGFSEGDLRGAFSFTRILTGH